MPSSIKRVETRDVEFEPDAWERFKRAVSVVAKSPPQHRVKRKPAEAGSRRSNQKKNQNRKSPKARG